jgi:8-oxo-dGTP diphosphatase
MDKTSDTSTQNQLTGVCVIVLNKDSGKILLGKRKNSYRSGYYGFPGGRAEFSEKIFDGAKRELLEETGLNAKSLKYLGVIRDLQGSYYFIHFVFLCTDYEGEPKVTEPDKCESWEWFNPKAIPEKTLPGHEAAVDIFLNLDEANVRDIVSN